MYIPENSPIGSTVGELYAKDPDEGPNAIVQYSIIGNLKIHFLYHYFNPICEKIII